MEKHNNNRQSTRFGCLLRSSWLAVVYTRFASVCLCLLLALTVNAQTFPEPGDSTTLRADLQTLAKRLLRNKQGSIIAIEPSTGKVLCMVSRDKVDDGVNRAISMTYSPGSTFKTAQTLTLWSLHALSLTKAYPCHRGFYYNKVHIGCHPHHSPLTLIPAIGQSCNSYFCKVFQEFVDNRELYPAKSRALDDWARFMNSLGLGHPLGIDLPDEASGCIPDAAMLDKLHGAWNGTTIMWMGMGQGEVMTTPLQLCNLAAIIANRGWYYIPHVSSHPDSTFLVKHVALPHPDAYPIVIDGMRNAVISGTCKSINTPMFKICGKTGTAENKGHDHSIFMGFAPMEHPKVAVAVYVENGGFGADLAAPLASLIIEQAINHKLSPKSEFHAKGWEKTTVKITKVEQVVNLDDL